MKQRPKIRDVSILPKWFDLKKYAGAKNLDASGWYEQLIIRKSLHYFAADTPKRDWWATPLEQSRITPILNLTDFRTIFMLGGGKLDAIKGRSPQDTFTLLGVHEATVADLFWPIQHMTKGRKIYMERFIAQIFDNRLDMDNDVIYKRKSWIELSIRESTQKQHLSYHDRLLAVNLNLPDKVLVDQFKKFLAKNRKEQKPSGKSHRQRESFYKDWIAFGVLPFLDLMIWAKEQGVNIPNRVLADAIFPAGMGGEEVVRKTTRPLVRRVLGEKNFAILEANAAFELAESYKGDKLPERKS